MTVASATEMAELDLASLPEKAWLVREMAFTLRFDLNNVASGDFLDTGVPARQNDNTFIEPLVTACERLAPEDASLPPSGDKLGDKSFSKEALKHLCRGKDAYRSSVPRAQLCTAS